VRLRESNIERSHGRFHVIIDDVGVEHGGGEAGVAQGFLYQADVLGLAVELGGVGAVLSDPTQYL
jgi:hypothetical protein